MLSKNYEGAILLHLEEGFTLVFLIMVLSKASLSVHIR